jgi:hypothetical protein
MILYAFMLQILYTTVFRDKRLNNLTIRLKNRGINITQD